MTLADATIDMLRHRPVPLRSTKENTLIVDGAGDKKAIQDRVCPASALELDRTESDFDREKLQERLSKLSGGVAVLKVGAATEPELKEKKSRIEDALQATRAAVEEGIVAGGGVALVNAVHVLWTTLKTDRQGRAGRHRHHPQGYARLRFALSPRTPASRAASCCDRVKNMAKGEGLNCATGEYGNMIDMGVNDPVKVTRTALESAASVAALILITECNRQRDPQGSRSGSCRSSRRCSRHGRYDVIRA